MVIFGATGELTKRLLIPALYNLARTKVLPENFLLIGVARTEGTSESWRVQLYDTMKSFVGNTATEFDVDRIDEEVWKRLAEKMVYVRGDLTKPELYEKLRTALGEAEKAHGTKATPSSISRLRIGCSAPWWNTRQGQAHRSGRGRKRQAPVLAPCGDRKAVRS